LRTTLIYTFLLNDKHYTEYVIENHSNKTATTLNQPSLEHVHANSLLMTETSYIHPTPTTPKPCGACE